MTLGRRIEERMKAIGMSQAELARRIGISQPSVYALLHRNKSGSRHLHRIAHELGTTPAYLSGETDDPLGDTSAVKLSSQEQRLIEIYRDLPKKDQAALKTLLERMADNEDDAARR
jgi:transcriptional regulator with XRE-family HTH domain